MAQLNTKILLLNGTSGQWEQLASYVLSKGEPAVEFVPDVGSESAAVTAIKLKIGDGFTQYKDLPYVGDHLNSEFAARFDEIDAAMASMGNAVFQVAAEDLTDAEGDSEGTKLKNFITETVNEGNIAIVTKTITDGVVSRTAYAYTKDGTWAALDGNYDAKDIYFSEDLTYTSDIGALKLADGKTSDVYAASGKSLEALIKRLMAETIAPTITQPTFKLSASASSNTTAASKEIGSYITTLKWDGTFTDGTYSFGYAGGTGTADTAAGCTATYEVSNNIDSQTATAVDGTFTLSDDDKIQIDSTSNKVYATITNKCTWGASPRTPINNIGDEVDGAIATSSSEKTAEVKVQGYRNSFYYVGTDNATAIDSAFIRSTTPRNANTTNFEIDTKTPGGAAFKGVVIPANTTRVMFAVPGTYNNIAVINVDGMGLPEDGFVRTEVDVEGANGFEATKYSVFTKENANGMAATGFTATIS
jgi:hypothetical protein